MLPLEEDLSAEELGQEMFMVASPTLDSGLKDHGVLGRNPLDTQESE